MTDAHELAIERVMDAPVAAVWRAFTDHLAQWWCPRPWTTQVVALDWRAGGRFAMTMHGPDGEVAPIEGVILDVAPERRMVFTTLLDADWMPRTPEPVAIVGIFAFAGREDGRTDYRAAARHASDTDRERHRAMGFEAGWGAVAAQLEAVARSLG